MSYQKIIPIINGQAVPNKKGTSTFQVEEHENLKLFTPFIDSEELCKKKTKN